MAKRYKMTWNWTDKAKTVGRWQKKYKGKRFACKQKVGESKTDSYARAWAAFELWRADQDKARQGLSLEQQELIDYYTDALLVVGKYYGDEGYEHEAAIQFAIEILKVPQDNTDDYKLKAVLNDQMLKGKIIAERRMREEMTKTNTPQFVTIKEAVTLYVQHKTKEGLSVSRLDNTRQFLNEFVQVCQANGMRSVNKINGPIVTAYITAIKDKQHKDRTIRDKFTIAKMFITWCWENEHLQTQPRNMTSLKHKIKDKPDPQHYTMDEMRTLYQAAEDDMKLYMLLAINCGYTQSDIALLEAKHIKDNVIDRERGKTGVRQRHTLWPETARLLNKKGRHKGLLLNSSRGNPLIVDKIIDGKRTKSDTIRGIFFRLTQATGVTGNFKKFRKTGAWLLETQILETEHKGYITDLYLAHANNRISKYYTDKDYLALDEPLAHLGTLIMAALKG